MEQAVTFDARGLFGHGNVVGKQVFLDPKIMGIDNNTRSALINNLFFMMPYTLDDISYLKDFCIKSMPHIVQWCEDNLEGHYFFLIELFNDDRAVFFEFESDCMAFKLKFAD